MKMNLRKLIWGGMLCMLPVLFTARAGATIVPITAGCIGTCGLDTTGNGDVLPAPGFTSYTFVTTTNGVTGGGTIPVGAIGNETDGSTLTTAVFSATPGAQLQFYFNYVTSDGSGYPDYGWAYLESSTGTPLALLFTARTLPSGTISPGVGLPTPVATLTPSSVPIMPGSGTFCGWTPNCNTPAGGPVWAEIGTYSGDCWAYGCGLTGWIQSDYTITTAGNYELAFGVTNANDIYYDTGMAIDGVTIAGTPVPTVPEPTTLALLGLGLGTLAMGRRKLAR